MWAQPRAGSGARQRGGPQRGLALVTVLWVLMLLTLIAASFMATTRLEINLTRNLIENAEAEALADAGVYRAIWDLLTPTSAGGRPLLNSPQFERFLRESGEPVEQTRRMIERDLRAKTGEDFSAVSAENDRKPWRVDGAKDAPFEAVQELQQVLGMTPLLYSRLEPLMTVSRSNLPRSQSREACSPPSCA